MNRLNDGALDGMSVDFINQFPGMLGWLDLNHKIVMLNKTARELLGFKSLDHAIGKTSFDLPCEAQECADSYISQDNYVIEKEQNLTIFDICKYSNGEVYLWLTSKSLTKNKNGKKIGVMYYTNKLTTNMAKVICNSVLNLASPKTSSYWIDKEFGNYDLSNRQQECLFYLIRGKTYSEIAVILGISKRTVESYVEFIKSKLGCERKSEIIEKSIANGMLFSIPKSVLLRNSSAIL